MASAGRQLTLEEIAVVIPDNKRLCQCSCCGELIDRFDEYGRERRFKKGHFTKGKKLPTRSGSNHHNFKADNVGYHALHDYVNSHMPKPIDGNCEICMVKPHRNLANVTGIYKRDFNNWKYLCVSCHRRFDYDRAGKSIPQDRKCCNCGLNTTYVTKDRRRHWFVVDKDKNLYQCSKCYSIANYYKNSYSK